MGLLLSVLVTCVGVVELLDFYHNVRRRVADQPIQTSLATFHSRQIKELEDIRESLTEQLERLRGRRQAPSFRLNSHEDIEIEFNNTALVRSRSPSPRRFLVSEKPIPDKTRHFVVIEEPQALQGVQKSRAQECVPEYLIEEEEDACSGLPRFLLKDGNDPVPLPLPETFLVSEKCHEVETKTDNIFKRKLGHSVVELDGEIYYRRSPSPFPSFDLTVPRNSICSELMDGPVSVAEVDEPRSGSLSPVNGYLVYDTPKISEKVEIILNDSSLAHSSTDFWENTKLIKKSKSRSPSPNVAKARVIERKRSNSESNTLKVDGLFHKTVSNLELSYRNEEASSSSDGNADDMEVKAFTEQMKNSLDGVDRSKGCVKKRLIKRKRIKNRPDSANCKDVQGSRRGEKSAVGVVPASANGPKPGEPFWVKH